MQLEIKKGINDNYIIQDSSSNDITNLKIALEVLQQQKQRENKTLILSDISSSGKNTNDTYREVNALLEQHKINRLIGIGKEIRANYDAFSTPNYLYSSTNDFLQDYNIDNLHDEMILIKSSHNSELHRIANHLLETSHQTKLEINFSAITHNLNFFRSKIKKDTKIMVMVKAFSYGSGMSEVTNLLQYHGVDYMGVAYTHEGVDLRKNGIKIPIMVMNPSPDTYEQLLEFNLEPEVYSLTQLRELITFLDKRNLKIHLKFDTGMRRLGFDEDDLNDLITNLKTSGNLEVASIFSHLAAADDNNHEDYTRNQAQQFKKLSDYLCNSLRIKPLRHLLNSAGIIQYPEYQFDMVRLGIGLYGVEPAGIFQTQLKSISTLKTTISQIREVKAGSTIGYGRKGQAVDQKRIATIAIGYADGYSRSFSNGKGEVSINGTRAPVIGNVCMDMTMVDVTGIEAAEGDEVVLFGEDPTIRELAERIGTIPYEILTSISERVNRVHGYDW